MDLGYEVFAPIPHSHSIEINGMEKVRPAEFWLKQDFAILQHCSYLFVNCIEGWEKSEGIKAEIEFAKQRNIPVIHWYTERI